MIGAIDEFSGLRHYSVIKGSNNKDIFTNFLKGLHSKLGDQHAYIVLDNLSVHHSKVVREAVQQMSNLQFIWLPPYSCSLNPIEKLWNLVKNKWRRLLITHTKKDFESQERIVSQIEQCTDSIPLAIIKLIFYARNRAMIDALNGKFV